MKRVCHTSMVVQSILFDRSNRKWKDNPEACRQWLRDHKFTGLVADLKPNTYRFRQIDPDRDCQQPFGTITIGKETDGIAAVVCCSRS